ncbi:MAG: response regulator [Chloroflexota bacterium]|jgi:two-component system, OmpR family, alkaline phosphatase synthesis response regulator PhoP
MSSSFVLIVEDDAQIAEIFSISLESIGLKTQCAADGQAALASLAKTVPDLVLLDLHLPHISGLEILKYIRSEARLAHVPVILATADNLRAEELHAEADLVLLKPVSPMQLRQLTKRLLFNK